MIFLISKIVVNCGCRYQFCTFSVSSSTPLELVIRDHMLWWHLHSKFPQRFVCGPPDDTLLPQVKDVVKWMVTHQMPSRFEAQYVMHIMSRHITSLHTTARSTIVFFFILALHA
jgi:hypothetical protein